MAPGELWFPTGSTAVARSASQEAWQAISSQQESPVSGLSVKRAMGLEPTTLSLGS